MCFGPSECVILSLNILYLYNRYLIINKVVSTYLLLLGGYPGSGKAGGTGKKVDRYFRSFYHAWDTGSCHGVCDCDTNHNHAEYGCYYSKKDTFQTDLKSNCADRSGDEDCNGKLGDNGVPGNSWSP